MTVEKQWYEKATTYAVSTEIYLPFSNFTVDSLFYFYLPCFHRYCLDETLHHGYIKKMVIISQRSLSRFRDVKKFFSHCSRVKGVTRGSIRFRAIQNKLLKSHSVVPRYIKFPQYCSNHMCPKEGMVISLFHRYTALKTQANLILSKSITYSFSSEYCCFDN